jgi:hypothetical protein
MNSNAFRLNYSIVDIVGLTLAPSQSKEIKL